MSELTESVFNKGIEQGIERGISQGISQGATQKARSTALAMLERHLDANLVAECTGLTLDEVLLMKQSAQ